MGLLDSIIPPDVPKHIQSMLGRLKAGCSEADFSELRCDKCGSALDIHLDPTESTFFLFCINDTAHLSFTEDIDNPPDWLKRRKTDGWYS